MRVLVVDDHPALRAGIALILQLDLGATEVVEAPDVETALEVVVGRAFDLAIVDLRLSGRDGISLIAELAQERPALPVIALSSSDDPEDRRRALAAGALGFASKSADRSRFVAGVLAALRGEAEGPGEPTFPGAGGAAITARQRQVLARLALGESNKEIARALGISDKTVRVHVTALLQVLGVDNRTRAVVQARARGLL